MPQPNNPISEKKKFTFGGLAAAVLAIVIWIVIIGISRYAGEQLGSGVANEVSNSKLTDSSNIQKLAEDVRSEFNPPVMIDEVTRLDNVVGNGSNVRYEYMLIGVDTTQVDVGALRDAIASNACGNVSTKNLIDRGVGLEYNYSTESQADVINFTVTEEDCN